MLVSTPQPRRTLNIKFGDPDGLVNTGVKSLVVRRSSCRRAVLRTIYGEHARSLRCREID